MLYLFFKPFRELLRFLNEFTALFRLLRPIQTKQLPGVNKRFKKKNETFFEFYCNGECVFVCNRNYVTTFVTIPFVIYVIFSMIIE